ncbi:hypothetical protein NDU88_007248 [Pleurodeles waltl]|uniref:Uncharacterized protein n=1 Tax=Pleurodeles waltl TaxID=8319 RepID=A0AAV7RSE6_PLEWA|nr:hypothetical protein NDU88_007248 [Pleurodeles waltl]
MAVARPAALVVIAGGPRDGLVYDSVSLTVFTALEVVPRLPAAARTCWKNSSKQNKTPSWAVPRSGEPAEQVNHSHFPGTRRLQETGRVTQQGGLRFLRWGRRRAYTLMHVGFRRSKDETRRLTSGSRRPAGRSPLSELETCDCPR